MASSTDQIEKRVLLRAPRERVWRAISDSKQFGAWFGVELAGPFVAGKTTTGKLVGTTVDAEIAKSQEKYRGYCFEFAVDRVEPMRLFSFRWHPSAVDSSVDYSKEPTTLVAFQLEEVADGTMLTVIESGFDQIPIERRAKAFASNEVMDRADDAYREVPRAARGRLSPPVMARASIGAAAKRADAAAIFAALGDETRLRIVARLCEEGPLSIMRLTNGAKVSRQAITKHLHALEEAGLARGYRAGRESVWQLRANRLAEIQRYLNQISQDWDAALGRLRAFVESDEE